MDEKLKTLLEQTLRVTTPLASASSVASKTFLVTTTGIYRISMTTLRDVYYLSLNKDTGASILDLTRKIIEHGISVEYMILRGKEEFAEKFKNHLIKQRYEELTFLKSVEADPFDPEDPQKNLVDELEREYAGLSSEVKNRNTWAGKGIDDMLKELHLSKSLSDFDFSRITEAYIWGCRLNHPNPLVTKAYLDQEHHDLANKFYTDLGILVAIAIHLRITTRLIDESRTSSKEKNIYEEIVVDVKKIQDELYSTSV